VYNIGIGVQQGKGSYADTNIVTFAPLYEIDNQSSHKLAIAQRHIAQTEVRINAYMFIFSRMLC
jgi:vacuolar protein sorting-associated protein 13D